MPIDVFIFRPFYSNEWDMAKNVTWNVWMAWVLKKVDLPKNRTPNLTLLSICELLKQFKSVELMEYF